MMNNSIAQSLKSCLTLCGPMNCSLPGFSVQGILQARILSGCCFLLQGIFPTQGLKHVLCLLHWQVDSSPLAPPLLWCFLKDSIMYSMYSKYYSLFYHFLCFLLEIYSTIFFFFLLCLCFKCFFFNCTIHIT